MHAITRYIVSACILLVLAGIYFRKKAASITSAEKIRTAQPAANRGVVTEVQPFVTEVGWGYIILRNGRPYIRQNTIPAVAGNKGFATREKALRVGELVAARIRQSVLMPAISKQELDSLQLLH